MDYKEFESQEQNRFLDTWYDYKNTRLILTDLSQESFPSIRGGTKKGLEQGVAEFLKKHGDIPTIYLLSLDDLRKFYFGDATKPNILAEVEKTHSGLKNLDVYAHAVSEAYSTFVYQDSVYEFGRKFNVEIKKPIAPQDEHGVQAR